MAIEIKPIPASLKDKDAVRCIPIEAYIYADNRAGQSAASSSFATSATTASTIDLIPDELKCLDRWVVWRREKRSNKRTRKARYAKVPINAKTGRKADCTESGAWSSFSDALISCRRLRASGVGFVFTGHDGFCGVDIDNCRNVETGEIAPEALKIIKWLDSYTEISPSGTGVKIFLIGVPPFSGHRRQIQMTFAGGQVISGEIEVYCSGRYFTVTGQRLQGPAQLENRQAELEQLCAELFPAPSGSKDSVAEEQHDDSTSNSDAPGEGLTDVDLIHRAGTAQNGAKFQDLFAGKWESDYASQSEAEFAFCCILAFWTSKNAEQIDRLFRQSALYREKWDERHASDGRTYGEVTIQKAIDTTKSSYKRKWRKRKSKSAASQPGPTAQLVRVHHTLPNAPVPEPTVVPANWKIGESGIDKIEYRSTAGGGVEEVITEVAPAPVLITARLKNANDGTESTILRWLRDGAWIERTVLRGQLANNRSIVELANYGLPVISHNAGDLVRYLAEFESANITYLPCTRVSNSLGWQGEDSFLWGRNLLVAESGPGPASANSFGTSSLVPTTFQGMDVGDYQMADGYKAAGTFEEWLEAVVSVCQYPRVMLAICASLAAPLLWIFGVKGFVVDWSYRTSSGKTTTLRGAASCWGNPDEGASDAVIKVWDATRCWIERACGVLKNLPLILDDTKRAQKPEWVSQVIYDVSAGHGRGRGSKLGTQRSETWSTVLLSTGEAPATSFTKDGGMAARVLEVWGFPFNAANAETAAVVQKFDATVRKNYGHAGPKLIKYMLGHREFWPQWRQELADVCTRWRDKAAGSSILIRQSEYFAVLEMTARLAVEGLDLNHDYSGVLNEI